MLQAGGGADLGQEAVGAHHGGEFRLEDLERDPARVPEVVRQVDGRHPAFAQFAFDAVAAVERGVELRDGVGHWAGDSGYRSLVLDAPEGPTRLLPVCVPAPRRTARPGFTPRTSSPARITGTPFTSRCRTPTLLALGAE